MSDGARVAILMGSDSDLPVMAEAAKVLDRLGVTYEVHVTSAHRSPERTLRIVRGRILTISCLDNLTKGAAGAAVQNFNLMFDFPETTAL